MNRNEQADRAGWWIRVAARTAAAMVALVAGAASFEHIASVAIGAGERTWVAYSLPVAIDGLIVVGVTALIEDQRLHRRPRGVARLAVVAGVAATLAANIASAEATWTARLVALAAPVSFLVSVEVLTRAGRKLPADDVPLSTADATKAPAIPATTRRARKAPARRPSAANRVVKAAQETPEATTAEIAARLKVSERTVQRHWPKPATPNGAAIPNGAAGAAAGGNGLAPVPPGAFSRTGERP